MRTSRIDEARGKLLAGLETARKKGASAAKIVFRQSESAGCDFENGRLKSSRTRQGLSFTVEALSGGRRGQADGNDFDDLDEIIDRAVTLAKAGSAAHFEAYPAPGERAAVRTHSERTVALSREKMIDACQTFVDRMKAYDPELYVEASSGRAETEKLIATSGGLCEAVGGTGWHLNGSVQRTQGTDMLFAGYSRGWKDLNELYDVGFLSDWTLRDLRRGERIAESVSATMPAVLTPQALSMLLWAVMLGVNGRNVAKGDSPLRGRLGEAMFDPALSVIDDPHTDFVNGASAIDEDGVPTRVIPLIENGVLRSFLYDLDSAGMAGVEPTGNGGCQPHSLCVPPGEKTSDDLIADIDDGIYLYYLLGFGQGNILNGDFSANVGLGFRIRAGQIVGRVKNTMVAGNIYDLLKQNVRLSSDVEPTLRMPFAVIEGLNVVAGGA